MIADLKPYSQYKDSGLQWLGPIPKHWGQRRMKFLFSERIQKGFPKEPLLAATQNKGVVRKEDYGSRTVTATKDFHLLKLVESGDFVISLRSFEGGIELAHCRGIISPAYTILTPMREAMQGYYKSFFKSSDFIRSLTLYVTGIREGQNIDYEKLSRAYLPLPPEEEQISIGRFLAWANGRLERAIRAKRKVIALLNEQKQAIIHRAVTRGLDPNVPLKPSGIPWLGDIPKHWEVRRAKQVCCAIVDCKNRTPTMVEGGEYIVVRTTNIRHGRFNPKGSFTTNRQNFEIWTQRGAPRLGDVFFTREAPVGEACLVPDQNNFCMGQRMMYFRPNTAVMNPEFLLRSIYGPIVRRYIEIEVNGSTVGHLRLGQVTAIPLLWCPIEEQQKIVDYVTSATAPLDTTIFRLEQEIELLREYRTRLVADVVTGKLDVREAAARLPDEVAAEIAEDEPYDTDEIESSDDEVAA
ncbi:MAG TPA: restriction endonuclease subunit S [Steroidobacteraceae bacterium]|nr:restriction endonuclease subunit S [Steroidobacteraceae bacterium]